jgi:hypothetical protein
MLKKGFEGLQDYSNGATILYLFGLIMLTSLFLPFFQYLLELACYLVFKKDNIAL